ncbi:MAG: hypothetical protein ACOC93_06240 [Planctomycetota bacterium]
MGFHSRRTRDPPDWQALDATVWCLSALFALIRAFLWSGVRLVGAVLCSLWATRASRKPPE